MVNEMDNKYIDMSGKTVGEFTVIDYAGNGYWNCECSCGTHKKVRGYELRKGVITDCGHVKNFINKFKDISGQTFGELTPLEYIGNNDWKCKCSCGKEVIVGGWQLRNGKRISCGHSKYKDLIGQKFNEWTIIELAPNSRLRCRCSCGKEALILYINLKNGTSKSCGHNKLIDLTGKQFGDWKVLKYLGDNTWLCKCSCGNIKEVLGSNLRNGTSKSCGCKAQANFNKTMLDKYGEISYAKVDTNRSKDQIAMVDSRENLLYVIENMFETKPTTLQLANVIGVNETNTLKIIHKFKLESYVALGWCWTSSYEDEIAKLFPGAIQSDRKTLHGEEIDLLYADKKIGIEFNGSYWHSDVCKHKDYHKDKTVKANRAGIRLIHIFEYEWTNENKRQRIINIIDRTLNGTRTIINENEEHKIIEISNEEANKFLNKYHILGGVDTSINIGYIHNEKLIGIMTFTKSHADSEYEYKLARIAWKDGVEVNKGSEMLFKYFIESYKPKNIIAYCDIAKFEGSVYVSLGFRDLGLTEPDYIWINLNTRDIKEKYNMQDLDEEKIRNLGYIRIYDCGNIKFIWNSKETS